MLPRDPSAFLEMRAGRRSRFPFEACSGFTHVAARQLADPPVVGHCPESLSKLVTLLAVSVATGVNRQLPQTGLSPARTQHLFTAPRIFDSLVPAGHVASERHCT